MENIFAKDATPVNEMPTGFDTPENFLGISLRKKSNPKRIANEAAKAEKKAVKVDRKKARVENIRSKAQSRVLLANQGIQQQTGLGSIAQGLGGIISSLTGGGKSPADDTPIRSGNDTPTGSILAPSQLGTANDNNPTARPLIVTPDNSGGTGNIFGTPAYTTPTGQTAAPVKDDSRDDTETPAKDKTDLKKYLPYALGAVALYFIMKHK